jgi:FKBP-type peptidyl-prolyl cis-trans isomerase
VKKLVALIGVFILIFVQTPFSFAWQAIFVPGSGLKYQDLEVGTGATAEVGKVVVVHLTGWLDDNGRKGEEFFSSYDRGKPVSFKLGTGNVMQGWNEGVAGMKVGGRRRLMIPANLGYGAKGAGDIVPPDADLIFDIALLDVK